jgi:PAS domain S-box-containing protein
MNSSVEKYLGPLGRFRRDWRKKAFAKSRHIFKYGRQRIISNPSYLRNILLLLLILVASTTFLGRILLQSNQELETSNIWISHSYAVIDEAEKPPALLGEMLANQRAYLLTEQRAFFNQYVINKKDFIKSLDHLDQLTKDNPAQQERVLKIRKLFKAFTSRLESRATKYKGQFFLFRNDVSATLSAVRRTQGDIIKLNDEALESERVILQDRISLLESQKQDYYRILLFGGSGMAILIFLFNALILYSQSRRAMAERSLKESEERFMLAIEGTNDGIFDWDIARNKVFYSHQFFTMLGYDRGPLIDGIDEFKQLLHPDDKEKMWQALEGYLHHESEDFSATFRMLHADGSIIWVQSRAKAIFSRGGHAMRIVGSNADITVLKEYMNDLERSNQELDEFSHLVSHDLKEPLRGICTLTAFLLEDYQDKLDAKGVEKMRRLIDISKRMEQLIKDLLYFSEIGRSDLAVQKADPNAMVDEIRLMLGPLLKERNAVVSVPKPLPQIICDKVRVTEVFRNLITNAVKYNSKPEKRVEVGFLETVDTERGREKNVFYVRDNGNGIEEEHYEDIFRIFKRLQKPADNKDGGTGAGLTFVKKIIEHCGGRIWLESRLQEGTVFYFTLSSSAGTQLQISS